FDCGIAGRPFNAAVPAYVVVRTVAIVFPVGLVVLAVVRDEIIESKPIVTGHEIDALLGLALFVAVNIGTAQKPRGQRGDRTRVRLKKMPQIVTESAVPFLPGVSDEASDLIEPGGIPRFRDQLRAG